MLEKLSQQALLLDYIYDAGWINREGQYHDLIHNLQREIELNITRVLGPGWMVKTAYARLLKLEYESAAKSSLQERRGNHSRGLARPSKKDRGTRRRNSNSVKGRASSSKAKKLSKKKSS